MTDVTLFLKESNAIENVWDGESLKRAKKAWEYLISKDTLTVTAILTTHAILMEKKLPNFALGAWRRQPVWVGGREGKPWYILPELMENWILDALTSVKVPGTNGKHIDIDHVRFENIHPFVDGNGRMGRILLNWQRIKAGLPILVIKESEKDKYYEWFK